MPPDLIERRISLVATIGAVVVFLLFALLAPAGFPSFDEWKYFGIGYNIWAGRGLTTVFGGEFLLHGPIWSAVVTLPHVLFGTDSAAWGRILNGLSGATIVALSAWFGWRIRPAAGAFAAIAMVGMLYLHDQSRTARLDIPAAAFALLFVAVGIEALRRNSVRWAIGAGAVFAIGFLIKEIDLPFLPIPFFVSVLWGLSWVVIGRISAWTVLIAALGVAPWFALYASETGRVLPRRDAGLDPAPGRPRDRRARRHRPDRRPDRRGRARLARRPLRTGRAPRVDDPADRRPRRRAGLGRRPAVRVQQDRAAQGRPDPDPPAAGPVRRHVDQAVLVRGPARRDRARARRSWRSSPTGAGRNAGRWST